MSQQRVRQQAVRKWVPVSRSKDDFDAARTNELPPLSQRRATRTLSRPDVTGEIDAGDILVELPVARPPARRPAPAVLAEEEIVVEVAPLEVRPPSFSINATQEIQAEDMVEVLAARHVPNPFLEESPFAPSPFAAAPSPLAAAPPSEMPSAPPPPWTVDTVEEDLFAAARTSTRDPQLTVLSTMELHRRRSRGTLVVGAVLGAAAGVMLLALGIRLVSGSSADETATASASAVSAPTGIFEARTAKTTEHLIYPRTVNAGHAVVPVSSAGPALTIDTSNVPTVSIDALPRVRRR